MNDDAMFILLICLLGLIASGIVIGLAVIA
jgi:hypothetical protein